MRGRTGFRLVVVSCLVYVLVLSYASITRVYNLRSGAHDLGIFVQALYSTINGRLLYEAPDYQLYGASSYLGIHFSPILLTLAPVYYLYPRFETLLVLQSAVISLGAVVVYLFCLRVGCGERVSTALAILYLAYPFNHSANLYDFHMEALLGLLTLALFYFYETKSLRPFVASAVALSLTMEAGMLILFAFSVYILLREVRVFVRVRGKQTLRLEASIGSREWAYLALALFAASPPAFIASLAFSLLFIEEAPGLGEHVQSLLDFFAGEQLRDPLGVLEFWVISLSPLLMTPLLSPLDLLPAAPYFLLSTLSGYPPYTQLGWQYSLVVTPSLFVATARFVSKVKDRSLLLSFFAASVVISLSLSPLSPHMPGRLPGGGYNLDTDLARALRNKESVESVLRYVDEGEPLLSSYTLFPFVANSLNAYSVLPGAAGYLDRLPVINQVLVRLDERPLPPVGDEYSLAALSGRVALFKRGYEGGPVVLKPLSYYFRDLGRVVDDKELGLKLPVTLVQGRYEVAVVYQVLSVGGDRPAVVSLVVRSGDHTFLSMAQELGEPIRGLLVARGEFLARDPLLDDLEVRVSVSNGRLRVKDVRLVMLEG